MSQSQEMVLRRETWLPSTVPHIWAPFLVRKGLSWGGDSQDGPPHLPPPPTGILGSSLKGHSLSSSHTAWVSTLCALEQDPAHPRLRSLSILVRNRCQERLPWETHGSAWDERSQQPLTSITSSSSRKQCLWRASTALSLVLPVKCRGGDQLTFTFLAMKVWMDPDNNMFSFVVAYLLSPTGKLQWCWHHETTAGSHSLFVNAWWNEASAGTGYSDSGGAQEFHDFKKAFQILLLANG